MTPEQFNKANAIQDEIEFLNDHKEHITNIKIRHDLFLRIENDDIRQELEEKLLPIKLDQFIDQYIQNIEKRIVELEKEFKNL